MTQRTMPGDDARPAATAETTARAARRAQGMRRLRRRRLRWWAWRSLAMTALLFVAMAAHYSNEGPPYFSASEAAADTGDAPGSATAAPVVLAGAVVRAELLPPPAPARPVKSYKGQWWRRHTTRAKAGESIEVSLTAYCLRGTTRRDNYVRQGIVASDPRVFPLGRYVEVYIGDNYLGRFLVDDTGGVIKGAILDIWTPTCREARLFGRQKGTAILVARNADPAPTPDVSKLMPYVRKRGTGRPRPATGAAAAAPTPGTQLDSMIAVPKAAVPSQSPPTTPIP